MIIHEITCPKPPERRFPTLREIKNKLVTQGPQQTLPTNTVPQGIFMEKVQYAQWIEFVKKEFPLGVLVTLKRVTPDNKEPVPLFRVTDINEMHYMAPIADVTKEPRCVYVTPERVQGITPTSYPPGLLRKLSLVELDIVHLRNKTAEKQRAEDDGPAYAG